MKERNETWYRIADSALALAKGYEKDGASNVQQAAAVAKLLESKTGISNPITTAVEARRVITHLNGLIEELPELVRFLEAAVQGGG